jgi:hypothetical protein
MGGPLKKKTDKKTPPIKPRVVSRRTSKYSRPLTEQEINALALIFSSPQKKVTKPLTNVKPLGDSSISLSERQAKEVAKRKRKTEELKKRLKESREKKKPLTKKKKEEIKGTIRYVIRGLARRGEGSVMENIFFGSTSSQFRTIVKNFPEQFKEVLNEPAMKNDIRQVLKRLGKRI